MANNGKIPLEIIQKIKLLRSRGHSLPEISREVSKFSPKLSQIWIMGSIRSENPHTYTVTQLFPEHIYHNFDYMAAFKETQQRELIRARRDLTKKTLDIEFEALSRVILPLP